MAVAMAMAAMAAEGATYGPLRIPELRWLCQQRGLTPYGRKRELLSRLEEQDQQEEVPFVECPAPGLEPFRELEELAAQLAEAKLPATAAATASAVPKVAPAQPKGHPVAPAQAKVPPALPPALPPAVPAAVPSVPTISRPEGVGLSHEERALRSLLEFFACSDVERKGQDALFNCKYREFIHSIYHVLQPDLAGASPAATTAAAATAAAAACTTDVLLRSAATGDGSGTGSTEMWKKCMELIENHLQVCHLQIKHDALCEELEAINKAALEKSQQVSEVRQQLDQLIEVEASQRQQLLGRARLQLGGWLEKAEEGEGEGLEGMEAMEGMEDEGS